LFAVLLLTRRLSASGALWAGMLAASLPAGLLPFAKGGGFENDLLPIVFLVGPATLALLCDALDALERWPRVRRATGALVLAAGGAFLLGRSFSLARWSPDAEATRRARDLDARVASLEGGVIAPRS